MKSKKVLAGQERGGATQCGLLFVVCTVAAFAQAILLSAGWIFAVPEVKAAAQPKQNKKAATTDTRAQNLRPKDDHAGTSQPERAPLAETRRRAAQSEPDVPPATPTPLQLIFDAGEKFSFSPAGINIPLKTPARLDIKTNYWKYIRVSAPSSSEVNADWPQGEWKDVAGSLSFNLTILAPPSTPLRLEFANSNTVTQPESAAVIKFIPSGDGFTVEIEHGAAQSMKSGLTLNPANSVGSYVRFNKRTILSGTLIGITLSLFLYVFLIRPRSQADRKGTNDRHATRDVQQTSGTAKEVDEAAAPSVEAAAPSMIGAQATSLTTAATPEPETPSDAAIAEINIVENASETETDNPAAQSSQTETSDTGAVTYVLRPEDVSDADSVAQNPISSEQQQATGDEVVAVAEAEVLTEVTEATTSATESGQTETPESSEPDKDIVDGDVATRSPGLTEGVEEAQFVEPDEIGAAEKVNLPAPRADDQPQKSARSEDLFLSLLNNQQDELGHLREQVKDVEAQLSHLAEGLEYLNFKRALANICDGNEAFQIQTGELEKEVTTFFQRGLPRQDTLDEVLAKSERTKEEFEAIFDNLNEKYSEGSPKTIRDLHHNFDQLKQFTEELRDWQAQREQKQVKMAFAVQIPTYENARVTFINAIVGQLAEQIKKLRDPKVYFQERMEKITTASLIRVTEICDRELDPQRVNTELQSRLKSVFVTVGLEEIAPGRNEIFQPSEHSVIETVRTQSGTDTSHTIAHLLCRGFRYQGALVKKASVKLFE